jgi:hypothetical protein
LGIVVWYFEVIVVCMSFYLIEKFLQ